MAKIGRKKYSKGSPGLGVLSMEEYEKAEAAAESSNKILENKKNKTKSTTTTPKAPVKSSWRPTLKGSLYTLGGGAALTAFTAPFLNWEGKGDDRQGTPEEHLSTVNQGPPSEGSGNSSTESNLLFQPYPNRVPKENQSNNQTEYSPGGSSQGSNRSSGNSGGGGYQGGGGGNYGGGGYQQPAQSSDYTHRVTNWQKILGVEEDGIWGPKTEAAYQQYISQGGEKGDRTKDNAESILQKSRGNFQGYGKEANQGPIGPPTAEGSSPGQTSPLPKQEEQPNPKKSLEKMETQQIPNSFTGTQYRRDTPGISNGGSLQDLKNTPGVTDLLDRENGRTSTPNTSSTQNKPYRAPFTGYEPNEGTNFLSNMPKFFRNKYEEKADKIKRDTANITARNKVKAGQQNIKNAEKSERQRQKEEIRRLNMERKQARRG